MSKLILLIPEIANIFVAKLIGENAVDKYKAVPTEWPNLMKSDVVYEPFHTRDRKLPPILVEVQHTVDLKFYLRVNEYCLQMLKRYPVAPIVITICINTTTQDVLDMDLRQDNDVPYVACLPCHGWAKSFYLMNAGSIHSFLELPMDPLVAVAHFVIEQKQTLISMERKDDPTIQKLFTLAKDIFGTDVQKYENVIDALDQTCTQAHQQLAKASQILAEDVKNPKTRKRTAKLLEDGLIFVDEMRKKHHLPVIEAMSSATPTPPPAEIDLLPIFQHESANWRFVDAWKKKSEIMNWAQCYKVGKELGLFTSYKSEKSLKSAYFRLKSQPN